MSDALSVAARPNSDLPSTYVPSEVEGALYERWETKGYFTPPSTGTGRPYCIVIPPPNVTGSLHIGHAFQHTLMDALTRRRRMQGYDTLWLPGMDHAGIATQTLVERQLAETEGKSKHDYTREEFVAKVWDWKAEYGGKILGQMRRLGDGVDWSSERFTMDEGLSRAVQTIFKRLYDDGLDLPRRTDHQLVSALPDRPERHRGRAHRGRRRAGQHPLRSAGRSGRAERGGGHHPGRDDAGRHRGRGAPGRRAVRATWSAPRSGCR